jgi:hypothetical protein
MTKITPEEIVGFVRSRGDMQLATLTQKQAFQASAAHDGLEFVPASEKLRRVPMRELASICDEFGRTNSMHPGDYLHLTVSASYIIALIDVYLKSK